MHQYVAILAADSRAGSFEFIGSVRHSNIHGTGACTEVSSLHCRLLWRHWVGQEGQSNSIKSTVIPRYSKIFQDIPRYSKIFQDNPFEPRVDWFESIRV